MPSPEEWKRKLEALIEAGKAVDKAISEGVHIPIDRLHLPWTSIGTTKLGCDLSINRRERHDDERNCGSGGCICGYGTA